MPPFVPVALLALALSDSIPTPYAPLLSIDDGAVAWTVEQAYQDTTRTWRTAATIEEPAPIETPGQDQVLLVVISLVGEGTSTGIDTLPVPPTTLPVVSDGVCGRIFSIDWKQLFK